MSATWPPNYIYIDTLAQHVMAGNKEAVIACDFKTESHIWPTTWSVSEDESMSLQRPNKFNLQESKFVNLEGYEDTLQILTHIITSWQRLPYSKEDQDLHMTRSRDGRTNKQPV
ncbi:hypothetical protein JTB14_002363 [Gonioctena quinquepunctata]|nr:hypothetical protein JTB14_002363 [Gonioctena quinquepunctata]